MRVLAAAALPLLRLGALTLLLLGSALSDSTALKDAEIDVDSLDAADCATYMCQGTMVAATQAYIEGGCMGSFEAFQDSDWMDAVADADAAEDEQAAARDKEKKRQQQQQKKSMISLYDRRRIIEEEVGIPPSTALTLAAAAGVVALLCGALLGYMVRGKTLVQL